MVLEEWPTQAVAMMTMMMMMVARRRIQKQFLATNQGRGGTVDYLQSQHIYNKQHTTFSFNIFFYSL